MAFEKPQDYVEALKRLEGLPLMGMGVKDGQLVFHSLSSHVALPMDGREGCDYGIVDYGLNKLDVDVDHVYYHDHLKQVMLFDEDSNVIAHVTIKDITRENWLLAEGVVFTEEAGGLAEVFMNWLAMDSPVDHIIDQDDPLRITMENGSAVELFFKEEDIDD